VDVLHRVLPVERFLVPFVADVDLHDEVTPGRRSPGHVPRLLTSVATGPIPEVIDVELIPDADVETDGTGWYLADKALDRVHNSAAPGGYGLVEFHNHRAGPPQFSRTDEAGLEPMACYEANLMQRCPYGAGVYADGTVHVDW